MKLNEISTLPILLVAGEGILLDDAAEVLRSAGVTNLLQLDERDEVLATLAKHDGAVLVFATRGADSEGVELLERIHLHYPEVAIILVGGEDGPGGGPLTSRTGAIDRLMQPLDAERLISSVNRALEILALRAEVLSLKDSLLTDSPRESRLISEIVTQSKTMLAIFRYLEAIAPSPQPALITGESGTGKELIAKAIHRLSGRRGELVAVNVAGLDDTMFSDTLFGHTKGSYTGADRPREGLVTSAAEGTLFLDEIGDLSIASQVKLLRLLQDGTYYPLGADKPRQSRARVIVATNSDVLRAVSEGKFRKDLYYRLRTHHFHLPPLRARPGDLPLLVDHFVEKAARALAKPEPSVPPALFQLLKTYGFPGNIRELEALVFDAVARHRGTILSLQSFKEAILGQQAEDEVTEEDESDPAVMSFPEQLPTLKQTEQALIQEALRRADGNQGVAASLLGISRHALNKRLVRQREVDRTDDEE